MKPEVYVWHVQAVTSQKVTRIRKIIKSYKTLRKIFDVENVEDVDSTMYGFIDDGVKRIRFNSSGGEFVEHFQDLEKDIDLRLFRIITWYERVNVPELARLKCKGVL